MVDGFGDARRAPGEELAGYDSVHLGLLGGVEFCEEPLGGHGINVAILDDTPGGGVGDCCFGFEEVHAAESGNGPGGEVTNEYPEGHELPPPAIGAVLAGKSGVLSAR
jgi:hypothetical protein